MSTFIAYLDNTLGSPSNTQDHGPAYGDSRIDVRRMMTHCHLICSVISFIMICKNNYEKTK